MSNKITTQNELYDYLINILDNTEEPRLCTEKLSPELIKWLDDGEGENELKYVENNNELSMLKENNFVKIYDCDDSGQGGSTLWDTLVKIKDVIFNFEYVTFGKNITEHISYICCLDIDVRYYNAKRQSIRDTTFQN